MNARNEFINNLEYFCDNFNTLLRKIDYIDIDRRIREKELIQEEKNWDCMFHNIDIKLIKDLTLNNRNVFSFLYGLDKEIQYEFLRILSRTGLAIVFFEKYSERYQTLTTTDKKSIPNKLIGVINYIKAKNFLNEADKKMIEYLEGELQTIKNKHFTLKQLFQNLLYRVDELICKIESKEKKNNPSSKSISIVNNLIRNYFDYEKDKITNFTIKTDFRNFKKYSYYWQTEEPLILYHSK